MHFTWLGSGTYACRACLYHASYLYNCNCHQWHDITHVNCKVPLASVSALNEKCFLTLNRAPWECPFFSWKSLPCHQTYSESCIVIMKVWCQAAASRSLVLLQWRWENMQARILNKLSACHGRSLKICSKRKGIRFRYYSMPT